MLLASAVNVTLGWAWHTAYRVRHHWTLRREGALVAAAAVVLIGAFDVTRGSHGHDEVTPLPSAMVTAQATTVLTEKTPPTVDPLDGPSSPIPLQMPETAEAAPSPALESTAAVEPDAIGQAIASGKLYNDAIRTTGALPLPLPRRHGRHARPASE